MVDASVNGYDIGRRSLKKWDDQRWFVELTGSMCEKHGVDTGDQVILGLRIASAELPAELAHLLANDGKAKKVWNTFTPSSQRMVSEHVGQAKQASTRERRARQALGLDR